MGLEATYYLDSRSVNMRGHAGGHISLWWIRDVFDRQLGGEDIALAEMMSCIPIVLRKPLEETTVHLPSFTLVKNAETEKVIVIDCSGLKQACLSPVT